MNGKIWVWIVLVMALLVACGGRQQVEGQECPPNPAIRVQPGTVVGSWKASEEVSAWYNPTMHEYGFRYKTRVGNMYSVVADDEGAWMWSRLVGGPSIRVVNQNNSAGWVDERAGVWQCH